MRRHPVSVEVLLVQAVVLWAIPAPPARAQVEEVPGQGTLFRRGDADANGRLELTDAIRILNVLFLGRGILPCNDAADADDNGQLQITDPIHILNYLFSGQGEIPSPGPPPHDCGFDPTGDQLLCAEYESSELPCDSASGLITVRLAVGPEEAVGAVRLVVRRGPTVVDTRVVPLASIGLPDGTERLMGDAFFSLAPGAYEVEATPLAADGTDSAACASASATATVQPGQTTEVVLILVCRSPPPGGLDVLVIVTHAPIIRGLVFEPSKVTRACEPVRIVVDAADGDGDPLAYAWAVTSSPAGARYDLASDGSAAMFWAATTGTYLLEVRVSDPAGNGAALGFPVHVARGEAECEPLPVRRSIDDDFAAVAAAVPGFAGLYFIGETEVAVVLRDPSDAALAAAVTEARQRLANPERLDNATFQAVRGDFDFIALKTARDAIRGDIMALSGVETLDVNEVLNRVRIGISSEAARAAAEQVLATHGVDPAMARIEITLPFDAQQSLQDTFRPVIGGLQISPNQGGFCTMGPPARRAGVRGLITNSHCTAVQGGVEGTVLFQNGAAGTQIATESLDPLYFSGGACPGGRLCRFSDSSWHAFQAGATGRRGTIANPCTGLAFRCGSFPFDFEVEAEAAYPLGGEELRKVGRTTGESSGEVICTCTDINQTRNGMDTGFTMLCQDIVEAGSDQGDSGSPVVRLINPPYGVALYGALWGGNGSEFSFSAMANIESEIGGLQTIKGNEPPVVTITSPANGATVGFSGFNETTFVASVFDFEGGPVTLAWSSDVDGAMGSGISITFIFPSAGTRLVTVTADDGLGGIDTDTITVHTFNTPPFVSIKSPTQGQTLFVGVPYVFESESFDSESFSPLPCSNLAWTSSKLGDPFPVVGCSPTITFASTGTRTITLQGTDGIGAQGTDSVGIVVAQQAPGGGPVVSILNPTDNVLLDPNLNVQLTGIATDADPGLLSYQWVLKEGLTETILASGSVSSGQLILFNWIPSDDVPFNCGGAPVEIILRVTDGDLNTGQDKVACGVDYPVC